MGIPEGPSVVDLARKKKGKWCSFLDRVNKMLGGDKARLEYTDFANRVVLVYPVGEDLRAAVLVDYSVEADAEALEDIFETIKKETDDG